MAREKYGYAESSRLIATYGGGHIYSVVDNDNPLENGMLVKLGDMIDRENYGISTPAKGDKVVLVSDVIVPYDTSTTVGQYEYYHRFDAGRSTRAYSLFENDEYAIADYMVTTLAGTGKPAVAKNYLVATSDRKYQEVAKTGDVSAYGFVAEIEDIIYKSNLTLYLVRVIKNETVA